MKILREVRAGNAGPFDNQWLPGVFAGFIPWVGIETNGSRKTLTKIWRCCVKELREIRENPEGKGQGATILPGVQSCCGHWATWTAEAIMRRSPPPSCKPGPVSPCMRSCGGSRSWSPWVVYKPSRMDPCRAGHLYPATCCWTAGSGFTCTFSWIDSKKPVETW